MQDHEMEAVVAAIVGAFIGAIVGFALIIWVF
jgi:integral membrane sensor domain MASE1